MHRLVTWEGQETHDGGVAQKRHAKQVVCWHGPLSATIFKAIDLLQYKTKY